MILDYLVLAVCAFVVAGEIAALYLFLSLKFNIQELGRRVSELKRIIEQNHEESAKYWESLRALLEKQGWGQPGAGLKEMKLHLGGTQPEQSLDLPPTCKAAGELSDETASSPEAEVARRLKVLLARIQGSN